MDNPQLSLERIRLAPQDGPFVIGQLGQSLDGRIALPSGESKYINGPAALDHLHRLRAEVDAVVVGVGTVLADDPLLSVRRVPGRSPARVIIDPNGRMHGAARCLSDGAAPIYIMRRKGCLMPVPEGSARISLPANGAGFKCADIVQTLAGMNMRRILVEGGAHTISRFIDEGQLDRLHLLIGPVLLGSGKTGINLATVNRLAQAYKVSAQIYRFEGGDILIDCDLRKASPQMGG